MIGKEIPVRSGVYIIEADNGIYVGQTRNFYGRWMGHMSAKVLINPEIIWIEFIEDESERRYREYEIMREFDMLGIKILNKLR